MTNQAKKRIIEGMKTTIAALFTEHTPADVKYSKQNKKAAEALIALDKLLKP